MLLLYIRGYMGLFYIRNYMGMFYMRAYTALVYISNNMGMYTSDTTWDY